MPQIAGSHVPEARAHAAASIGGVLTGRCVMFGYCVQLPSTGVIRWLRNADLPISDGAAKVVSIGGIGPIMIDLKALGQLWPRARGGCAC